MNDKQVIQIETDNNQIINVLTKENEFNYNLEKAVEELLELAEVLMKKKLKNGTNKAPSDASIIEEIGDVKIRLLILENLFGQEAVQDRVNFKLNKYLNYYLNGEYKGKI